MPKPVRGKGPKKVRHEPTLEDHALAYVVSDLCADAGECCWADLVEATADYVRACKDSGIACYDEMPELTPLQRFAHCFLAPDDDPNNNHASVLAWGKRRAEASDESEGEGEGDADGDGDGQGGESGVGPCALMLGVQDATTLPSEDELGRLMAAAEESGVTGDAAGGESEVPADLEGVLRQLESVTRELGTLKQGVAATAQVHVSELKRSRKWEQSMLSASSGEQHKRKREIQSQASELARLERQVLVQGQALKEMQLRLQQSDTGRDPQTGEFAEAVYHPLAHAGRLGAPTDSQIVALAYAMERTFPCKAVLSDLCKLLRFKAHATSPGGGRCSPREQFCNKRYSLDMWRDLAVNRGVFWSCYNFLLLRQPYSTLVDPSKGEPGVLSYHNSRFVSPPPGGRMPWHGAPEGVYTGPPPLPRLIYTASDSDGSELPASPSGVLLEPRRHSSATPLMSGLMLYSPLGRPASQPMGREALLPPPKRSPSGQLVRLSPASPGAPRGAARQRATIRRAPRMVGIGKPLRVGGKRATVDSDEEEEESEGSEESEGEASGDSDGEEAAQSREEAALEAAKGRPTRKEKRETKEAQETEALEEARLYEREAELCHPDVVAAELKVLNGVTSGEARDEAYHARMAKIDAAKESEPVVTSFAGLR